MLTDAVKQAGEGRYVYVIVAADASRGPMMRAAQLIADKAGHSTNPVDNGNTVKLYVGDGEISFETAEPQLDWSMLRMRGAHPSCAVNVDHFALEWELIRRYGEAIRHVERWASDEGKEEEVDQ